MTSFSLFKYMALYSLIQFASVLILYSVSSIVITWLEGKQSGVNEPISLLVGVAEWGQ